MTTTVKLNAANGNISRLFRPLKIGRMRLQQRIAMCPMTRCRTIPGRVPNSLVKEYYGQRACVPGTLIISEGIVASETMGGGYPSPGIWSKEQISAWKEVTEEVHRKGCFIVAQLFGFGRSATEDVTKAEGIDLVGPSAIPMGENDPTPRAMTIEEVEQLVEDFAMASRNAIEAGFDGVECHGANGYLLDQFLRDTANQRDDIYGGSIENRSRIVERVLEAMVQAVGADRVGLRLSPFGAFQGMAMVDTIPQHEHLIRKANKMNLMYLSIVEGRISGSIDQEPAGSIEFAYRLWDGPMLVAGAFTSDRARDLVDGAHGDRDVVVLFGRLFVSNPDLVYKIKEGLSLNEYDRSTFYTQDAHGYLDYPTSKEFRMAK